MSHLKVNFAGNITKWYFFGVIFRHCDICNSIMHCGRKRTVKVNWKAFPHPMGSGLGHNRKFSGFEGSFVCWRRGLMSRRVLSFPLPVETDKCVFPPFRIYDDIAIEGNCFFFHVLDGKRKPRLLHRYYYYISNRRKGRSLGISSE